MVCTYKYTTKEENNIKERRSRRVERGTGEFPVSHAFTKSELKKKNDMSLLTWFDSLWCVCVWLFLSLRQTVRESMRGSSPTVLRLADDGEGLS